MNNKNTLKIGLLLIIFLAPIFLGMIYFLSQEPQEKYLIPTSSPPKTPSISIKPLSKNPPNGFTHPPLITGTPEPSSTPTPKVDLLLTMPLPGYDLCCGFIPSKVTIKGSPVLENRGALTAHNVQVLFELFRMSGERIKVDGKDSITRQLGDIGAGESVTELVEFDINLIDGYSIQDNGAIAYFRIISDEKSMEIREEFLIP